MKRVIYEMLILAVLSFLQDGTTSYSAAPKPAGLLPFVAAHRTIEEDDEMADVQTDDGAGDAIIEDLSEGEEQGSIDEYTDDDDGAVQSDGEVSSHENDHTQPLPGNNESVIVIDDAAVEIRQEDSSTQALTSLPSTAEVDSKTADSVISELLNIPSLRDGMR